MASGRGAWWLGFFLILFCHALGFAEPELPDDLNRLLERVQQTYDDTHALSADFVQIATLNTLNREQTSAGRVYIQKPHAIRWEYTQPEAQTILYKDDVLSIYTPKRKQVLQSTVPADDRRNVALLFLAGIGKLREVFTIEQLPSTDASTARLRLLPRSPQAGFTELDISVNRQSAFIESLTIHDHIGNRTHIRFVALQPHAALPAKTFELNVPPDTEIVTQPDVAGQK